MEFDLAINNGIVVDGTGRPRFRADIGVKDGKIVAVSTGEPLTGRQALDAAGLIVAPGFIDLHSHSDWILPLPDHDTILAPLLLQGITTLVTGNCGFSPAPVFEGKTDLVDGVSATLRDRSFPYNWRRFGEFLDCLQQQGMLLNAAFLVGHGTLRSLVMGERADPPTPEELQQLRALTLQALQEGAFGLSAGLAYAPGVFADNDELLALLRVAAEQASVFTVHGRAYTWVSPFYKPMIVGTPHNVRSTRELIRLAAQARVRLELSHLIFVGRRTWRTYRTSLRDIEQAADQGQDLAFDAYPYTAGFSTINVVFPKWFLDGFDRKVNDPAALRQVKREIDLLTITLGMGYQDIQLLAGGAPELEPLEGLNFSAIAKRLKMPEFDAYMHVARLSNGTARILLGTYSGDGQHDEPLQAVLAHPLCSFMTDTSLSRRGKHNPASFGNYPRILGRYSRDLGLFSLEETVRRMTSFPAERIGLQGVGRIAEGMWADLVLFDLKTVADNTTLERADAPPSGIHSVLVSGEVAAKDGEVVTSRRLGRVLRH